MEQNKTIKLTKNELKRLIIESLEDTKTYMLKDIRRIVNSGDAIDISNMDGTAAQRLRMSGNMERIGISYGKVGVNGLLFVINEETYAIIGRTSNLFIFLN